MTRTITLEIDEMQRDGNIKLRKLVGYNSDGLRATIKYEGEALGIPAFEYRSYDPDTDAGPITAPTVETLAKCMCALLVFFGVEP